MPFDNPKVEVEVPHKEELKIVDKMLEVLDAPGKWCKDNLERDGRLCIIGALHVASWGKVRSSEALPSAAIRTYNRMQDIIGREMVFEWNDDPSTTFNDVRSALQRTRASFE